MNTPIRLSFITTQSVNPYHNLALEQALGRCVEPGEWILYLWQNEHTVVIGRNQNAWKECRVAELEQAGGYLARRRSGGGAVFHDLGNLNFTFVAHPDWYSVERNLDVICRAMRSFGLDAKATGRNDVTIDGAKFSGNAFFNTECANIHHGTIMFDVRMEDAERYLTPDVRKLRSKGVESVRARVVNISTLAPEVSVPSLIDALRNAFIEVGREIAHADIPVAEVGSERADQEFLTHEKELFASKEWLLGAQRSFELVCDEHFEWGGVELTVEVDKGIITHATLYSDALDADFIQDAAAVLGGVPFSSDAVYQALCSLTCENEMQTQMRNDLARVCQQALTQ